MADRRQSEEIVRELSTGLPAIGMFVAASHRSRGAKAASGDETPPSSGSKGVSDWKDKVFYAVRVYLTCFCPLALLKTTGWEMRREGRKMYVLWLPMLNVLLYCTA